MHHLRLAAALVLSLLIVPTLCAQQPPQPVAALIPAPQDAAWAQAWWMPRHEEKLREKAGRDQVDLILIGDSITHGWESAGKATWDKFYAPRNALNLGFSGDRTEQVLWRLQHDEVDGLSPKVAVVMIGTNNTGHRQDPAVETAAGIRAIVEQLHAKLPDTQVLLLAIFPRGATPADPLRKLNSQINERIAKLAESDPLVTFLDINDVFLEKDGELPKSIMGDLLHPNEQGYELWAEAMEPTLASLLKE